MERKHGGKRDGAGRKRNNPLCARHGVYITNEQARLLRIWGKGDLSAGLRWLITAAAPMICRAEKQEDTP